jgi:hypothetical protein
MTDCRCYCDSDCDNEYYLTRFQVLKAASMKNMKVTGVWDISEAA